MITRIWILGIAAIGQAILVLMTAKALFEMGDIVAYSVGFHWIILRFALHAILALLVLWVIVSHILISKRYNALKTERA